MFYDSLEYNLGIDRLTFKTWIDQITQIYLNY
jgi:hypothetical protein